MRGLKFSSLTLKIIACIAMLADHTGLLLFPEAEWLRIVGRLAFPLFAFLLVQGVIHTRDIQKYMWRLAGFALISQIPYSLMLYLSGHNPTELNIFFLLTLGVGVITIIRHAKQWWISAIVTGATIIAAELLGISYGAYGIIVILACYWLRSQPVWGSLLFVAATIWFTFAVQKFMWVQIWALASLPLIFLYNGKPGKPVNKWLFYWFYPAHMVVLCAIKLIAG